MKKEYFETCSCCGAHLDPGESCDCRKTDRNMNQEEREDEQYEI